MPAKKKVNINLLLKSETVHSFSDQLLSWALTYGRYIIIITQIFVLSVFFARFKLDRDYTDLKELAFQKKALIESVSDLDTEIRRVQNKLANIKTITSNQDLPLEIIHFLQENIPANTRFSTLTITSSKITFAAKSGNLREFSYFLQLIQKGNKLTNVALDEIRRLPDGRIDFAIRGTVNQNAFN